MVKTQELRGTSQESGEGKYARRRCFTVCCLLTSFFFLLLAIHGSRLTISAASWSRQQSGTMAWLHSIHFLDQQRGWVAGSSGTLLRTTDGGITWKKISTLSKDNIRDVYFADDNAGWLLIDRDPLRLRIDEPPSYLLKTEDGGFTWRRIFLLSAGNARLVRMVFFDAERGCVFGETGTVFASRDGGAHWMRQASPTKHLLLGGAYANDSHTWIVGAGGTIIRTRDAGASWQAASLHSSASFRFHAISFVSDSLGWAAGSAGRIITTTDAGRTWYPQQSHTETDLLDIKFVDAREGWAVGGAGVLLHTVDGGTNWTTETSGVSHALQRLFFIDRSHGWAVGFGGTILAIGQATRPSLR